MGVSLTPSMHLYLYNGSGNFPVRYRWKLVNGWNIVIHYVSLYFFDGFINGCFYILWVPCTKLFPIYIIEPCNKNILNLIYETWLKEPHLELIFSNKWIQPLEASNKSTIQYIWWWTLFFYHQMGDYLAIWFFWWSTSYKIHYICHLLRDHLDINLALVDDF